MEIARALAFAVGVLSVAPPVALAQKPVRSGPGPATRHDAFSGPRSLAELEHGGSNRGVRVVADVDDDGDADVLLLRYPYVTATPDGAEIWLNGGHADFELAHEIDFDLPYSSSTYFVARDVFLTDVTGDGIRDFVCDQDSGSGPILSGARVHPGLGDGSFGPATLLEVDRLLDLAVGDCDGDGDADLLLESSTTSYQHYLTWWTHEASGFVAGSSLLLDPTSPVRLTLLDLEGDGDSDVVSLKNGGYDELLVIRTVDGAPTFDTPIPVPSEFRNPNTRIQAADLDRDGDCDLLVTLATYQSPDYVTHILPIFRSGAGFELGPVQDLTTSVAVDGTLADWDEDGDLDLVSRAFAWMENDGETRFTLVAERGSGDPGWGELAVADMDGDSHLDVLSGWTLFLGDGDMPRALAVVTDSTLDQNWPVVEDWEGDGDLDLVRSFSLYLNRGDGTFEERSTPFGDAVSTEQVGWGDFDGDGFRDVIASVFEPRPYPLPPLFVGMRLYSGDDQGQYHISPVVPSTSEMEVVGESLAADIDGDGDEDLLMEDAYWRNDGSAHFGTHSITGLYTGQPEQALDIDGDGDLDLLVRRGSLLDIVRKQPTLAFTAQPLTSYSVFALPAFLDVDQDGDLDLAISEPTREMLWVHEQLPSGVFAPRFGLPVPELQSPVGQIDVDGDGRLDLVCTRGNPYRLLSAWVRGDGLDFVGRRDWVTRSTARRFGDFDGDGDVDVQGRYSVENEQFHGREAGRRVQYALDCAIPGTGGIRPVLGARGPFRSEEEPELLISRGRGGAAGLLHVGRRRGPSLACSALVFIAPVQLYRSYVLDGTPGAPGAGTLRVPLVHSAAMIGSTFTFQSLIFDPGAPNGYAGTNALEITMGDWAGLETR